MNSENLIHFTPLIEYTKRWFIANQLEKLEAARSAYLWLLLLAFAYLCLPLLTFAYLCLPLLSSAYLCLLLLLSLLIPSCVLLVLTGPYWALLGLTWPYWALLDLTRLYLVLLSLLLSNLMTRQGPFYHYDWTLRRVLPLTALTDLLNAESFVMRTLDVWRDWTRNCEHTEATFFHSVDVGAGGWGWAMLVDKTRLSPAMPRLLPCWPSVLSPHSELVRLGPAMGSHPALPRPTPVSWYRGLTQPSCAQNAQLFLDRDQEKSGKNPSKVNFA